MSVLLSGDLVGVEITQLNVKVLASIARASFCELRIKVFDFQPLLFNRPFSYSDKESQSNDTLLHVVGFANVHNCDRSSEATRSNLVYKNV